MTEIKEKPKPKIVFLFVRTDRNSIWEQKKKLIDESVKHLQTQLGPDYLVVGTDVENKIKFIIEEEKSTDKLNPIWPNYTWLSTDSSTNIDYTRFPSVTLSYTIETDKTTNTNTDTDDNDKHKNEQEKT